jgi:hypothetical protein
MNRMVRIRRDVVRLRYVIQSGLLLASLATATDAIAQMADGERTEDAPAVSLSIAPLKEIFAGSGFLASAQFPLTSNVYVEGAFSHRWHDRFGSQRLAISTLGANLIVRAGSSRWGGYLGAGLGVERSRLDQKALLDWPIGPAPGRFTRYGPAAVVLGGAEASVARRLQAFGEVRVRSDLRDTSRFGIAGGLRAALSTRPPTEQKPVAVGTRAARGRTEVRITLSDGQKRVGRLVALTQSDVAFVDGGTVVTLGIGRVTRVEIVTHYARTGTLIGAAWAGLGWIMVAGTRDSCADCEDGPYAATIMTPIALGAGAGIGAFINAATRHRHVLYQAPQRTPVVDVKPSLAPERAALMFNLRW